MNVRYPDTHSLAFPQRSSSPRSLRDGVGYRKRFATSALGRFVWIVEDELRRQRVGLVIHFRAQEKHDLRQPSTCFRRDWKEKARIFNIILRIVHNRAEHELNKLPFQYAAKLWNFNKPLFEEYRSLAEAKLEVAAFNVR